jgi:serine/threonine protein kinase
MQALEYLHSENIYYGDMKEANLLIFRDFSVKIGDFGVCIKMKENLKEEELDEYSIKGLTPGYITLQIESYFQSDSMMDRKDLLLNDYYALYVTF